ncbi:MAG: 50S ribosomal protein L11 methyltransferase, partial [Fimbriimonadales bacterium]|nr:50S ribosomal protein L11 methyltransferase [Fimbriimonadales bacterium]
ATALIEHGCTGVELREAPPRVVGYLPATHAEQLPALQERLSLFPRFGLPPILEVHVEPVQAQAWQRAWRRYFRSRRYGDRLRVQPSWSRRKPQADEIVIVLDPGIAFGTGNHPTTALCLELLGKYVRPGTRVADIGTGTGVLAIAAAKLGAREVLAIENDSLAVLVARGNIERNGVADRVQVVEGDGWHALQGQFDLIVCNILSGFLIQTAPLVPRYLYGGGVYIVSGFIGRNAREVRRAIESAGLRLEEVRKRRSWVAAVFRKP